MPLNAALKCFIGKITGALLHFCEVSGKFCLWNEHFLAWNQSREKRWYFVHWRHELNRQTGETAKPHGVAQLTIFIREEKEPGLYALP
jgi:hypothetical protein